MPVINTIVVPQGAEYQAVCRGLAKTKLLSHPYTSVKRRCLRVTVGTDSLNVIPIPIGVDQATQVLANYSTQLDSSINVLILGLCGSLSDLYTVKDAVLVKSCEDLNHNLINLDPDLTATLQQKLSLNLVSGLTSDRIITQSREKLILAQNYAATIVEMEGYGYVRELQSRGLSVAMVRVVSDDLGGDIPDLNQAIDHQGKIKAIPLAIALIKQPIAAVRLIKGSLAGLKALEQITTKLF